MFNNKLYVYGDQSVQVPAHLNFGKYMLDRLRCKRDEVAIGSNHQENDETGEKITYKELTEYSVKLSVALTKLGVKKGDVVAIGSEKQILLIPMTLAIVFSGATCTPYNLGSGRAHLNHEMSLVQPDYFIYTDLFWKENQEVLNSFKSIKMFIALDKAPESITSVDSLISVCDVDVDLFEPVTVQGQVDAAFVFYSTGTTGMPKGILQTHNNCILCCQTFNVPERDFLKVIFVSGEWYHNYDFFVTYEMLGLGKKIVYTNNITPEIVLRAYQKQQVELASVVPSMVDWLLKTNEKEQFKIKSLKIVFSAASLLHAKTIEQLKKRFPSIKSVLQGYGMTEAGMITSENLSSKVPRPGSVGGACPGFTLKVVHPKSRKILGPNQHGEICVRGPALMKGYINVDPITYLDDDGFFITGDLGYYDEDGYFYIIDRLKEIIIYNGYNVAPVELETILHLHPDVREAGVVGKPVPEYGEEPTAFVVRQPGSRITEQELVDYVAGEVALYMQLKGGVKFISELPRNPRGKILRQRLREMLKEL